MLIYIVPLQSMAFLFMSELISKSRCADKKHLLLVSCLHHNHCIMYPRYYIGYEPADLTVHPPPPKRSRVGSFFSHRCLVSPKFFPKEKVDFVGAIRIRMHKNVVLRHNHSSPISTRMTLFDNIE